MTQINYKEEYEKAIEIINYFTNQGLCIKSVKEFPNDKIEKLDTFIESNSIFQSLDEAEQNRLIKQVRGMKYYFSILVERISNFK